MAYIKSDTEKDLILRNDKNKLQKQIKEKQKSLGLRGMIPQNNQNQYTQLNDINNEQNHIRETMTKAKEQRIKRMEEQRKANRKSYRENLKVYLQRKEDDLKRSFNNRRITYRDKDFSLYEDTIKMTSSLVLLKQIKKDNIGGIALISDFKDKDSQFKVISFSDDCNDIEKGDTVMIVPYCGIEIISQQNIYRIVVVQDILLKVD